MEISKAGGGLSLREDIAEPSFREHTGALSRSQEQHVSALLYWEVRDTGFGNILPHCFPTDVGKQLVVRRDGAFNRCPERIIRFFRVPTITHSRLDSQFEKTSPRVTKGMTRDPEFFRVASHQEQKIKVKTNE